MSEEIKNIEENSEKKTSISKENKIIIAIIAVIVVVIAAVAISYSVKPAIENKHQAELRAEAQVPECEHIKEAQEQLYTTKAQLQEKITSGFDDYWETYEKNFWIEFRKSHIKNYPDCFAAQNEQ